VTFARMGPDALKALGGQADALLGELSEVALNTRADARAQQTCAAVALVHLSPASSQAKEALPVLARAMLLKNAPAPNDEMAARRGFVPPTRPGFGRLPRPGPDPIELELHERAKDALVKAGRPAAEALAKTFNNSFFGHVRDSADMQADKRHARKSAFEVLA